MGILYSTVRVNRYHLYTVGVKYLKHTHTLAKLQYALNYILLKQIYLFLSLFFSLTSLCHVCSLTLVLKSFALAANCIDLLLCMHSYCTCSVLWQMTWDYIAKQLQESVWSTSYTIDLWPKANLCGVLFRFTVLPMQVQVKAREV